MLDPREQRKNGFGVFIAREQQRHFARETAAAARPAQAEGDLRSPYAPDADAQLPHAQAPAVAPARGTV